MHGASEAQPTHHLGHNNTEKDDKSDDESDDGVDTGMDGNRRLQFIGDVGTQVNTKSVLVAAQLNDSDMATKEEDIDDEEAFEREQLGRVMGTTTSLAATPQARRTMQTPPSSVSTLAKVTVVSCTVR